MLLLLASLLMLLPMNFPIAAAAAVYINGAVGRFPDFAGIPAGAGAGVPALFDIPSVSGI